MNTRQQSIPVPAITIDNRFRKDIGKTGEEHKTFESLKNSIKEHGLIHPIAVAEEEEGFRLLAGGRRLAAVKELGWTHIPCHIFPRTITDLESRTIELLENLDRKDMTYQEVQSSIAEIDRLMKLTYGELPKGATKQGRNKDGSLQKPDPRWGSGDTAKMLGVEARTVQTAIELNKASKIFPEVAAARTQTEAKARFQRIKAEQGVPIISEEDTENQELIDALRQATLKLFRTKDWEEEKEWIEKYQPGLVILNERLSVEELEFFFECIPFNGWIIYCPPCPTDEDFKTLRKAGFLSEGEPRGIWTWGSQACVEPQKLQANFEIFFYARRGQPVLEKPGRSAVFSFKRVSKVLQVHEAERPIEFWTELLGTFAHPTTKVYVPQAREGNVILAGRNIGVLVVGNGLENLFESFKKKVEIFPPGHYTSYPEQLKGVED